MQTDSKIPKIVDQALEHPVKYTFMLTKEVFILNKALFGWLTLIVVVLALLSEVPLLGIIASIISGILLFSLFIFTGKVFDEANDMDAFVQKIRTMTLIDLWNSYWQQAFGAYLGWVIIVLFLIFFAGFILGISGEGAQLLQSGMQPTPESIGALMGAMVIPLMLLGLILYLMPLVFAKIIRTDTFADAFKAVFTLFSGSVWRRAFSGAYFKYMALLGLVLIAIIFGTSAVLGVVSVLLGAIAPSLMAISMVISVIVILLMQILVNVFYAISSIIADRMTQDDLLA